MLNTTYNRPALVFSLLLVTVSIWYIIFPDIIPINQKFGFEGAFFYKSVAKNPYYAIFVKGVNSYSIQRILPFVLLHYVFKLLRISFTDANMLRYFELYNLLVVGLVIYYWRQTALLLRLNLAATWSGYIGLLLNFATLKYDTYVPFTYDRTALLVGMMSIYYHLNRDINRLLITALFSLIIWPTAIFINLCLLLVPPFLQLHQRGNRLLSMLWSIGGSLAFAGLCIITIFIKGIVSVHVAPAVKSLLPLSILLITVYFAFTQYTLARVFLGRPKEIWELFKQIFRQPKVLAMAALLVFTYVYLTKFLGTHGNEHLNTSTFLVNIVYGAVSRPLQSIVAHSNYYGLPVILALLYWKHTCDAIRKLGLGMGALFVLLMILSVNCETRQLANLLPVLITTVAMVVQKINPRPWVMIATAVLCLLQSKVWLRINAFDPTFGQANDRFPLGNAPGSEYIWNAPFQAYFMNLGPWTSNQFLVIEALVLFLMLFIIYKLYGNISVHDNHDYNGFSNGVPRV